MLDEIAVPLKPQERAYPIPRDENHFRELIRDWHWRIYSGHLYKIRLKTEREDDVYGDTGIVAPFKPNVHQCDLLADLRLRQLILKARQLGFSTLIEIMCLDYAMFNKDQSCLIVAHTINDAKKLMRDKIMFAYERLPEWLREQIPLTIDNKQEIIFDNGSSIEVSASGRGGTFQFVHISEMGKIAAKRPEAAREIVTGTLQAAPDNAMVFIESTAEGMGGQFHDMSNRAENLRIQGSRLPKTEYRFQFYAWWGEPAYRLDPTDVKMSIKDHIYFNKVEAEMDVALDMEQRAWYVSKRDSDFAHNPHDMLREYPSTPRECWLASTEGKYLANVMARARAEGRIGRFPLIRHIPVNSFWDLGASDDTVVWLHQDINGMDHWVGYREGTGEGYLPFLLWMESKECVWGEHFLPHDANNLRQTQTTVTTPLKMIKEMKPSWSWRVVPRVHDLHHGIELMRKDFDTYCFDEEACKDGIPHLDAYSRTYNKTLGKFTDIALEDGHDHAADALRQKAQGYKSDLLKPKRKNNRPRATGLTA